MKTQDRKPKGAKVHDAKLEEANETKRRSGERKENIDSYERNHSEKIFPQ